MKSTISSIFSPVMIQYALVLIVNLNVVTTGMNVAWPSPMLVKLRDPEQSPLSRPITEEEGAWIVSLGALCSVFTSPFGGLIVDSIGRKNSIILSSLPKLVASLLFVFASDVWMLMLGQAMMLTTDAFVFTVVPIYASEIASNEFRGSLGTILQVCSSTGIVITLSVGPFVSYMTINIILTVVAAVVTLPLFFIPESPYFLYSKGKTDKAIKVLSFIRDSESLAKKEIEEYSTLKSDETKAKIKYFKTKVYWKAQLLGLLILGGMQLIGFQTVSFYLQTILEASQTSVKPEISSVVIGCVQLLAAFCTACITDRVGRRWILIFSLVGVFLGLVGLGTFFKIRFTDGYLLSGFMNYLPLISLMLFVYCYAGGLGTLSLPVASELFDSNTRAVGMSVCIAGSQILMFLTGRYFAAVTSAIGPAPTFWIFSANCAIIGFLILMFIPETRGKSFLEIQSKLRGEV